MASLSSHSAGAAPAQTTSHPFTCNSCQVAFRTSEMQRAHMQTDWHRYNLKRRVASLPPLTSEVFTDKVLANKANQAATAARASFEKVCSACQKTYYSQNAYTNHLNSSKHRTNVAAKARYAAKNGLDVADTETASVMSSAFSFGEPIDGDKSSVADSNAHDEFQAVVVGIKDASMEDTTPVSRRPSRPHHSTDLENKLEHPLSATTTASSAPSSEAASEDKPSVINCLFCNYASPSFPLNMNHMSKQHGMFIPESDFLVDPEGLFAYLFNKINGEHECLYCKKIVHTTSGIQTHMRDRGHCMIAYRTEDEQLEVGEFYDFSSTWSDVDSQDSTSTAEGNGGVPLNDTEEDEGWETDSTISDVPTDEITAVPISDRSHRYAQLNKSRHHSHSDPRKHREADGWHVHSHTAPVAVYHDDYELHLPSGRTAGHRSLNRYYRQNLRSYPTAAERAEQRLLTSGSGSGDSDTEMGNADGQVVRGRGRDAGRQLMSRANGGLGMAGVSDTKKKEVRAVEKRERKKAQRDQQKFDARVGRVGNNQKHFRDPLLQ